MNRVHPQELAAWIGIDWADAEHAVALRESGAQKVEHATIKHTPEALVEWLGSLRRRFGGKPVGVALETSRGPLVHALLEHDFVVLYPINPKSLKQFREAFTTSGAKDDPTDADLLLEMLSKHGDRLRAWIPDDVQTRTLARLAQDRREAVQLRTKLTQQLRAVLKSYFPQALDWVGRDLFAPMAIDFLLKWPTLEAVRRARPETLRRFYTSHNSRSRQLIDERLKAIRRATPLTTDRGIIDPAVLRVQTLARQLQTLAPSIADYETRIEELFEQHPDADLFRRLPGSGPALGPRLLSAFGTDRTRFASAMEVEHFTCIAPITKRSGKQLNVRWRWSASSFVRQSFHEFARQSIQKSAWARAYYELQRDRGKRHHAAVRSLAYKWIRILYRCWKEQKPYDEARYLEALSRRGSPLAKRIDLAAAA